MKNLISILFAAICFNTDAQVCFTTTNYPAGNGSTTIASADFNNDGKLDLVATMYGNQNIFLLLGNGLGGFGTATNIALQDTDMAPSLKCFISGDFNNDGKADLAIANWGNTTTGYVKIYFGDGTGSFPTMDSFIVAPYPSGICSADFNGDGKIDIATSNNGFISVLLGDGTGNFSQHVDFIAGTDMNSITSGDFNGDGSLDIAATNNSNGGGLDSVWVFLGNGSGSFGIATKYLAGSSPYSVCSKDFNGDGFADIAVANWNSGYVSVFLSEGSNGAFYPATNYAANNGSNSVVSADFNGDGIPDLAVADFNIASKAVSILLGTGGGSFEPALVFSGGYGSWSIISADFNSDGKPDLTTANHDSPNVSVLLNVAAPHLNLSISGSSNICHGTSTTLSVNGAVTYIWSSNTGIPYDTITSALILPLVSTTYYVIGTENGCKDSAAISINVISPEIPNICMVTTDSSSNFKYNVVYWDKTIYNNVDSFIVYRKDAISSNYLRIGEVSINSLSEFADTAFSIGGPNGGNPQYSSWLYKLAIRDTCGNIGEKSPYHQSMFVQKSGSNFSWNAYAVELGQSNPITGYSFLRDDNNTGNWHVLVNTIGLSTTDPDNASYPNGNWRIDALGFNCTPTEKNIQSTFLKSHSNTTKPVVIGINHLELIDEHVTVYPNPTSNNFYIETNVNERQNVQIFDLNGRLIYSLNINGKTNIDATFFNEGIYTITIKTENSVINKKLVIIR